MLLSDHLYPEDLLQRCPIDYQYIESNVKLESNATIIYPESEVREYKQHKGSILNPF